MIAPYTCKNPQVVSNNGKNNIRIICIAMQEATYSLPAAFKHVLSIVVQQMFIWDVFIHKYFVQYFDKLMITEVSTIYMGIAIIIGTYEFFYVFKGCR